MKSYARVYAPVDLDAVIFNMESMKKNLADGVKIIGVVKADGYGHGAVPIARTIEPYVWGYAVASVDEALQLHQHNIHKPILILGVSHPSCYQDIIDHAFRPAIFTMEQAKPLSDLAALCKKQARIHLAVDTGMSRIGMTPDRNGAQIAANIHALPGIIIEGMFTHFATADQADKTYCQEQIKKYEDFVSLLSAQAIEIPMRHISNSAAIIEIPQAHYSLVRAGISMYGMYPSNEVDRARVSLRPVMGLKSFITYVKTVPKGTCVSYGGTFIACRKTRVATVPVGYGDGYPRGLSGKGYVLIHGQRAPILGRVCMDQFMVDVTDIPEVSVDTPVTLIGQDKTEQITWEDIAAISGGFHYELACTLGKRVPRVYYRNGTVVGTKDYFDDTYPDFFL